MRTNYPRRLAGFDYVGFHRYFLTLCACERFRAFVDENAVAIVWSCFLRTAVAESFAIVACCFMPDHGHMVLEGQREDADMKRFVTGPAEAGRYWLADVVA